jgi:hypothetical protein
MVYDIPAWKHSGFVHAISREWRLSAISQAQSGFPFTISVFGDTANAGTLLSEDPIRANYTGQPIFDANSRTATGASTPLLFRHRPHSCSAMWAATPSTVPADRLWISPCKGILDD